jgi:CRISPR/Cas system-associated endonuclease Cas3-HD
MVLRDIRDMLHSMGKDIREYDMPPICDMGPGSIDMMKELREKQNVSVDQEHLDIFYSLNKEQREGFDEIIEHVFSNKSQVFLWMVREARARHSYTRRSLLEFGPKD